MKKRVQEMESELLQSSERLHSHRLVGFFRSFFRPPRSSFLLNFPREESRGRQVKHKGNRQTAEKKKTKREKESSKL